MSYILNAIRKSEQDRQTQEASNPESTLLEMQPKKKSNLSWLIIALIIINILALIYFIFLNPRQQQETTIATAENKTPTLAPPIQPEKPKITLKNNIGQPKPEPTTKSTPKPSQKKSISNMLEKRRTFKNPATEPVVEKVVTVAKKTNLSQPTATLPRPVEAKPTPVKPQPIQVSSKPENAKKVPFLREMAPAFRRNVPNLNINIFVYAENPDDRFVIIDMKKYRIGQETTDGLKIKQIKSNSLVLRYNNRTFQIERP